VLSIFSKQHVDDSHTKFIVRLNRHFFVYIYIHFYALCHICNAYLSLRSDLHFLSILPRSTTHNRLLHILKVHHVYFYHVHKQNCLVLFLSFSIQLFICCNGNYLLIFRTFGPQSQCLTRTKLDYVERSAHSISYIHHSASNLGWAGWGWGWGCRMLPSM